MDTVWKFEHSVGVKASREAAWAFWSNVENWSAIDPGVEWARIDGAFQAGSRGETKPVGAPSNAWQLAEVDAGRRAVIELLVPGAEVRFRWSFDDQGDGGTVLTQVVEVAGDTAEKNPEAIDALAAGIPHGMQKLAAAIDRATCVVPAN